MLQQLSAIEPYMGCDPELFFANNGKVIESCKLIPKSGIKILNSGSTKIIRDGLQLEINTNPYTCRAHIGRDISKAIIQLRNNFVSTKKATLLFNQMVELSKEEMEGLDPESVRFGCAPSKNFYTRGTSQITVDPRVYSKRSAGGHIHIGGQVTNSQEVLYNGVEPKYDNVYTTCMHKKIHLAVRVLDIVVGNTCVQLDRDPNQVERRKVYGRAGEFRRQPHGMEYRTLSNFWLRSYQLTSLVFGLSRLAFNIVYSIYLEEKTTGKRDSSLRGLLKLVPKKDIRDAINNNDFDLAKKNFDCYKDFLVEISGKRTGFYPFATDENLLNFEHFVEKGIDYWFPHDVVEHWCKLPDGHDIGWESFRDTVVETDRTKGPITSWKINKTLRNKFEIVI